MKRFQFDNGMPDGCFSFRGVICGPDWNGFRHVAVPASEGAALLSALNAYAVEGQEARIDPSTGALQNGSGDSIGLQVVDGFPDELFYDLNGFGIIDAPDVDA